MFYYNEFYQGDLKEILNIDLPFENFKNKNISNLPGFFMDLMDYTEREKRRKFW